MELKLKAWNEAMTIDFPPIAPVTDKTVKLVQQEAKRYRGSMRISTGRIWATQSFEKFRQKVLNTKLP